MTNISDQILIELLPWYINGTLDAQQRADVEALLTRSENARQQLAELRSLATAIKNQEKECNSEFATANELGWVRLERAVRNESNSLKRDWWRPTLAGAAAIILALQVTIISRDDLSSDSNINWTTLGANQTLNSTGSQTVITSAHRVQVRFVEKASWKDIQGLLVSLNARLIDGPSTLGVVHMYVPEKGVLFSNDKELLRLLQQNPVIQHAAIMGITKP